ncbi:MAG: carbohydrate porin [Terracidiphilus sp.]
MRRTALIVSLVLFGMLVHAQNAAETKGVPDPAQPAGHSFDDLNFIGAEATMPPISDSVVEPSSGFRRELLDHGMALRLVQAVQFAGNTLQPPVPADEQAYTGEYPFESAREHLVFSADLRQLHLQHSQFFGTGVWNWVSWNSAGPKTFSVVDLYFYKSFDDDRIEIKTGYISNNLEFLGLLVGGSTALGAQGVYAILPYEVGLSYFPLTAPSFNLRLRGPGNTYLKAAAQRSIDAAGGPATVARNHSGFRFDPKGDKLLLIDEVGYNRSPSATAHSAWFRAGYMRNTTPYLDLTDGKKESGNDNAFVLIDYQLRQRGPHHPSQGLYLGGSAMTDASRFDAYNRYFEVRLYQVAPFRSRPADLASVVATFTGHSKYFTDRLVADGKTVWRNSASLTASYSLHLGRGHFVTWA